MGANWETTTIQCPNCQGVGILFINESEVECGRCKGEGQIEVMSRNRVEPPDPWWVERD